MTANIDTQPPRPIRFWLPLILGIGGLAILLLLTVFEFDETKRRTEERARNDVAVIMSNLQGAITYRLRQHDMAGVQNVIANQGFHEHSKHVLFIDERDNILAATRLALVGAPLAAAVPELHAQLAGCKGNRWRGVIRISTDRQRLFACYPAVLPHDVSDMERPSTGYLLSTYDLTRLQRTARAQSTQRMSLVWLLFGAGYLAVLLLLRHALARQRIGKIVDTTASLAAGNLDARARLVGRDELASIGAAVDGMAERLQSTDSELRRAHEKLEERVYARTAELSQANRQLEREIQSRLASERHLAEAHGFLGSVLDAQLGHLAVLDADGKILSVNAAWRKFAYGNRLAAPNDCIGMNYLDCCDAVTGEDAITAHAAAAGIRSVLSGESSEFQLEYPCHSPDQQRWFLVHVTRFGEGKGTQAVVVHENITQRKLMELEVRESEEKLRLFIENAPSAIAMFDREFRYVAVSQRWLEDFGLARQDIRGRSHYEVFPGTPERWKQVHQGCLAGASERCDEELFARADGIEQWIRWEVRPWRAAAGEVGGVVIFVEDITERKRAAEALRRSEIRYRTLIDLSPDAVFVSRAATLLFANAAMVRLLAAPGAEALIGRSLFEFLSPGWHEAVRARIRMMENLDAPLPPLVQKWRCFDGREVDVQAIAAAIPWDEGRATLVMLRDVTDLMARDARLQNLIGSTQDAVICINREARVVMFNPAAEVIFGYSKAEAVGEKVNILMAEPYASEHDQYIRRYEQTGEARAIGRVRTVVGRRKNGEEFPAEVSLTKIAMGAEMHYTAFLRDISEKVKLQQNLAERERLATIGATAAKFAHEIGNPLNGMYMTAQLLERRLVNAGLNDESLLASFRRILREMARLNSLLSEFRTFYRDERYQFRPTSIGTLIRDVLNLERPNYVSRGVLINESVAPDIPLLSADSDKLKQVLLNLCKNGVEAMPRGGTLEVHAACENGDVKIEIGDTGVGIPEGLDIFEPFKTTKPSGTGLGMVIVRQVLSAHKGTISYRSTPGVGTTFTIKLPLGRAH